VLYKPHETADAARSHVLEESNQFMTLYSIFLRASCS